MSQIALSPNASGTGTLTIAAPNTNSNRTLTLPDVTGTVVSTGDSGSVSQAMVATGVAGTGPAFSAYNSSATSMTGATSTKILFATTVFDTNTNFASSRFTPTVAGYYQINAAFGIASGTQELQAYIFKNGSVLYSGTDALNSAAAAVSGIVYCNGSTDYIEIYGYVTTTVNTKTGSNITFANGALVRAA